jgi:carboxymethylenebutenolidase
MPAERDSNTHDSHPIPQEAFDWYDKYAHGFIDRRTLIARLSTIATTTLTLGALLPRLTPDYAEANQVSFNDPDITGRYVKFSSPSGLGEGRVHRFRSGRLVPAGRLPRQRRRRQIHATLHGSGKN